MEKMLNFAISDNVTNQCANGIFVYTYLIDDYTSRDNMKTTNRIKTLLWHHSKIYTIRRRSRSNDMFNRNIPIVIT